MNIGVVSYEREGASKIHVTLQENQIGRTFRFLGLSVGVEKRG